MLSLLKSSKSHSKGKLRKHFKKALTEDSIKKAYEQFTNADNKKMERKSLLKLIDMCYNNVANQVQLAELLHLPFIPGPVSLHAFPTVLLEQNQVIGGRSEGGEGQLTQLQFLFNYLKNVREYYYCWVVYFNEDLKILNVKLLKKEEMSENEDLFNPILNLVGIFINKNKEKLHKDKLRVQTNSHFLQGYYETGKEGQPADNNHHNKSISTINSSTGTTWKAITKMEKIKEDSEQMEGEYYSREKKQRSQSKLVRLRVKEAKKHSLLKCQEQVRGGKKESKSYSIKPLKDKSKSHIMLARSKSNNFKEIVLQPIKDDAPCPSLSQKFKVLQPKARLKKESKGNNIVSNCFKRPTVE